MKRSSELTAILAASMFGGNLPVFNSGRPIIGRSSGGAAKNFKKQLSDYNIPPRSMTEAEKEYYARNKNLNGFQA